jgi:hypothetical protein
VKKNDYTEKGGDGGGEGGVVECRRPVVGGNKYLLKPNEKLLLTHVLK